jgi:uncharacterized membrane protein YphA (DoxX/SURF4 family)
MKYVVLVSRILLGLAFFVFGLNQFLHFITMPPPTGDAGEFFNGMVKARYFLPMLGFFQTACGLALLTNRFVIPALIILFAINLNIVLFHVFVEPGGLGMGIFLMALNLFLIYNYRDHFMHMKNPTAHH